MAAIRGGKLPLTPSQIFAAHLIHTTDGKPWKVEDDVWPTVTDVTVLRPVSVLRKGDGSYVDTDTMCARAPEHNANLGLADAPRLLAQPEKLKEFHGFYIPLPGTKLRDPNGNRNLMDNIVALHEDLASKKYTLPTIAYCA